MSRCLILLITILGMSATAARAQEGSPAEPRELIVRLSKDALGPCVKVYGASGIRGIPAFGTGVIVDSRGLILTAWSVALRTEYLRIVDDKGRSHPVKLHRAEPRIGVALLKTKMPLNQPAIQWGNDSSIRVGSKVLSFGNAFNVAAGDEKPGVVEGIVSAVTPLDARIGVVRGRLDGAMFILDAPNNPGTQGGPVTNLAGELIGINGPVVESRSTNTPLNFAVPISIFRSFLEEAVKNFDLERAPGSTMLSPEKRYEYDLGMEVLKLFFNRAPPVYIDSVRPDSPAAKAGLRSDDLIFQIAGLTIRTAEDYDAAWTSLSPGTKVTVRVKRGRRILDCELTLPEPKATRVLGASEAPGGDEDPETPEKPGDTKKPGEDE